MSTYATQEAIDKDWEDHWKEILEDKDGNIDRSQLKKELFDFSFMISQVPQVYMSVTGGRVSKPNTYSHAVIGEYEEDLRENYVCKEDLLDWVEVNLDELDTGKMQYCLDTDNLASLLGYSDWEALKEETLQKIKTNLEKNPIQW